MNQAEREALEERYDRIRTEHGHATFQGFRCAECAEMMAIKRQLWPELFPRPKKAGLLHRVGVAGLLALMALNVGCHFGLGVRTINQVTGKPGIQIEVPFPCEGAGCDIRGPQ